MNHPDIIAKIKKLIALGTSPEPAEAALALEKARELMDAHGISDNDIAMADVLEKVGQHRHHAAKCPAWQVFLADLVARHFGCIQYIRVDPVARDTRFVFVGIDPAVSIAQYCFDALVTRCRLARQAYVRSLRRNTKPATKTRKGDTFAMGFVTSVEHIVEGKARAVPGVVQQWLDTKRSNLTTTTRTHTPHKVDANALLAGILAGNGINLGDGVATKGKNLLE